MSRRPQKAAEAFMAPRHAPRRWPVAERISCERGGPLVAGGSAGQLRRLPQPITATLGRRRVPGGIPQLERPLEVAQGGPWCNRLGRVRRSEQCRERRRLIACPIEVDRQL